jgi:preprotein translocase subunit YajC
MVAELKKGDKVVTTGGMIGTVAQLEEKGLGDEDIVTLKIDDKIKIPVLKSSVYRVVTKADGGTPAPSETKETSGK